MPIKYFPHFHTLCIVDPARRRDSIILFTKDHDHGAWSYVSSLSYWVWNLSRYIFMFNFYSAISGLNGLFRLWCTLFSNFVSELFSFSDGQLPGVGRLTLTFAWHVACNSHIYFFSFLQVFVNCAIYSTRLPLIAFAF